MPTIDKSLLDDLTRRLNKLSEATRKVAYRMLRNIEWTDIADLRQKIIEILDPLIGAASDDAAAYAAQFYDDIRFQAIGQRFGATAQSMRNPIATEKAVRALMEQVIQSDDFQSIIAELLNRVDFEVKRAAGQCVLENARRDPKSQRWARVPTGAETCQFCLMLASRGFVYLSAEKAGKDSDGHYHANCDCRIVPGFDDTQIEGYDPHALYQDWINSDHPDYMRGYNRRKASERVKSGYRFEGADGLPSFKDFNDVKKYLYESDSQGDLEHRFNVLGSIYGWKSKQMKSQSLKNVVKTASKRIDGLK